MTITKLFDELRQFTGTEHWYQHPLDRRMTYTDGAKYLADEAGAYWLLDEIVLSQRYRPAVVAEPFQLWKLLVENAKATLSCEDGDRREVFRKPIPFTDFPEPGVELFVCYGVIHLPSEY